MKLVFNLEKIRKEQNLTQKDVATAAGLSQSYISEIESGIKSPTLKTLEKLINALNVNLSELLTEEQ